MFGGAPALFALLVATAERTRYNQGKESTQRGENAVLILVLILCLATSLYVALRRRDSLSLYLLGMSVCNLIMLSGIVVYIAKIGGTAAQQRAFLFLVPGLKRGCCGCPSPWTSWAMWWQ